MKIGIDVRCLMEKNLSGVGKYTLNLLQAIFDLDGVNQYFLFYNHWHKIDRILPEFKNDNVIYVGKHFPNKLFNLSINSFAHPALDKLLPSCDIFWVPSNNFVSWSKQTKKIITCHDLSWYLLPRFYSLKGRLWHKLIRLNELYKQADVIMAVSNNSKMDLLEYDPSFESKIKVTPLGVKKVNFSSLEKEGLRLKYNLPQRFILYVGNIEPRKNVESIIDSFKKIKDKYPDLFLVIAGGSGWHKGYYFDILKLIKSTQNVKYLGYVEETDKLLLYSLATIFLYPSFYEGFGLPPLEAMSQGCPVITSNNSSLPEVVGDAGILIDPHNINQIVAGIEMILNNNETRDDFINKGRERALQFEWSKTAQQMIGVFKGLL